MSENQFDGLPDNNNNNWDDTWAFPWNEFDWERHQKEQDKVLQAYLGHYEKFIGRHDRIDEVAHSMGWDQEDWTNDESEEGANPAESMSAVEENENRDAPLDPYTIQKHPVFIATRALFFWLQRAWELVAPACGPRLPMRTALAFTHALGRAEQWGLLATQSLDMGDFSLSVCQLKRAMVELNAGLHQLQSQDESLHPAFAQFRRQALVRLFDIREIWLRVMRDCRDEINRRVSEGEN